MNKVKSTKNDSRKNGSLYFSKRSENHKNESTDRDPTDSWGLFFSFPLFLFLFYDFPRIPLNPFFSIFSHISVHMGLIKAGFFDSSPPYGKHTSIPHKMHALALDGAVEKRSRRSRRSRAASWPSTGPSRNSRVDRGDRGPAGPRRGRREAVEKIEEI